MTRDATETTDPAAHQTAFDRFLETMPERLDSFITAGLPESVTVDETEKEFVKDLSPASLPWVEAYAVSRLSSPALASAPANQRLSEDLMRYVGETFIRTLGGTWEHDPTGAGHGMPYVRLRPLDTDAAEAAGNAGDVDHPADATVSVLSLLMTALQQRTGDVFVSALIAAAGDSPAEAAQDNTAAARTGTTETGTADDPGSAEGEEH